MTKKFSILMTAMALSTLVYVGCKSDSDDDTVTPTATCTDGIMNGTETGIDCGGTCTPCVTCSDGLQNGTETDIDCGGSSCAACAAKSMPANISGVGAFVADTSLNNTDSTLDVANGLTTYRIFSPSGPSALITFDLTVRFTNSLATIAPNTTYNFGNANGVYVSLIYKTTTGGVPTTYATSAGNIKFTKINHVAHTVSGTFEMTCNYSGTTRVITNGVFTNLKLK